MDKPKVASTPTVLQTEMTECGAACLSMILQYHGQYATLEELRLETDVSRDGCSAANIVRAARSRGLDCDGFEMDTDELMMVEPPCVLWWENDHFVVFEGVEKSRFLLNDPAYGKRALDCETMEKEYSGIVLSFTPNEEFQNHESYGKKPHTFLHSGKIKEALRSFSADAFLTCVTGLAAVGLGSLAALRFAELGNSAALDATKQGAPSSPAILIPFVLAILAIVAFGLSRSRVAIWKNKSELRGSWLFLRKMFFAPIAFLEDRYPENLVRCAMNNDRMNGFSAELAARIIICGGGIIIPLIAMAIEASRAGISALAVVIPMIAAIIAAVIYWWEHHANLRDRAKATILEGALAKAVFTDIEKLETIRELGCADEYAKRTGEAHTQMEETRRLIRKRSRIGRLAIVLIYMLGVLASAGISGLHTPVTILSWIALACILIASADSLIKVIGRLRQAKEDYDTTLAISAGKVQGEREVKTKGFPGGYQKLQGNIEVRSVAFGYGSFGDPLFEGIDLDIPGGSALVITGGTGCGKSTLGKLLAGLMPPSEGEIRYDGRLISEIPDKIIYASIATVKQKSTLFSGTIRENITMWNPGIGQREIERAAKDACIDGRIGESPNGYETRIGTGGRGLSGGEQQRIELARALATDPSILILDEAFSAIDDETTLRIVENIRRRGCTCIMITRDPLLMRDDVKVLDLDEVKQGPEMSVAEQSQ